MVATDKSRDHSTFEKYVLLSPYSSVAVAGASAAGAAGI